MGGFFRWVPQVLSTFEAYLGHYARAPEGRFTFSLKKFLLLFLLLALYSFCFLLPPCSHFSACWAGLLLALYGIWTVDLRTQLIPDRFQLLGFASALGLLGSSMHLPTLTQLSENFLVLFGLLILGWLYEKKTQRLGLGLGDIKLLAWLGLLSPCPTMLLLLIACFLAISLETLKKNFGSPNKDSVSFAFGPYIIFAWACFLIQGLVPHLGLIF